MAGNSIHLHRVLKASPEKVFRAFSNSAAYATWIPPYGFICTVNEYDFKKGGNFHMAFTNFTTGNSHSFGGQILELIPNEKLVYSDKFDNPEMQEVMTTTVKLTKVLCGTDIDIVQAGIPESIPVEMCYLGWQESLEKLMKLVEPEIADE